MTAGRRRGWWVVAVAFAIVAMPRSAAAQTRWLPRVRLDNDAYNFWRRPASRPDEEYTNGVQLALETRTAPWWGKRIGRGRPGCADSTSASPICLATIVTLGQDLFTPDLRRVPYSTPDWRDERPYFAWLYLSGEARWIGERSLRSVSVAAGVTGPPAGGELAQSIAHAINRQFTRRATGWETQIGFEPGVLLGYRRTLLALRGGNGAGPGFDVQPWAGVELGNIRTGADAGVRARLGWNVSHPWDPRRWAQRRSLEGWIAAAGRTAYVARDMSLDGTLRGPGRRVARVPRVGEYEVGAGVRVHWLSLTWRAVTRGREYRTGPAHHAWSSMAAAIEIAR